MKHIHTDKKLKKAHKCRENILKAVRDPFPLPVPAVPPSPSGSRHDLFGTSEVVGRPCGFGDYFWKGFSAISDLSDARRLSLVSYFYESLTN